MSVLEPTVTDANVSDIEFEEAIRTGPIKITGRLVDASNATMLATIASELDDEGIDVIYKPVAGERPLWDFPSGTLADREYATYLLSSRTGFNLVPFTTLREGPFGIGAVQQWIEIDTDKDLIEFFQRDHPALRRMALFDAIINNTDRKIGHLLPAKNGEVYGCDHGVTFHEEDKLRTVLWQWAGEKFDNSEIDLLENVIKILDEGLEPELDDFLTADEIKALRMRVERLITSRVFPQPSSDWPSVPWPPF